jgi:opacity protein-like surface antigen
MMKNLFREFGIHAIARLVIVAFIIATASRGATAQIRITDVADLGDELAASIDSIVGTLNRQKCLNLAEANSLTSLISSLMNRVEADRATLSATPTSASTKSRVETRLDNYARRLSDLLQEVIHFPYCPERTTVGFYIGWSTGKRWSKDKWDATSQTTLGVGDNLANPNTQMTSDPGRVKVLAGYDWRIWQNWLVGVAVDAGFGKNEATQARIPGSWGTGGITSASAALNDSISVKQTWDTSVRARFGAFVTPSILIYGTAGVDFLHMEAKINCSLAGACGAVGVPVNSTASTIKAGSVFGGGAEFGLEAIGLGPNWHGQIEYLHADLGKWSASFGNPATFATTADIKVQTDTVMAGVVYRFGN